MQTPGEPRVADGIILLSKPAGRTSFQALGAIKRSLKTHRIGHTGTLDRFADGLLLVLAGRLTRLCPYASAMDKEYVAGVTFGKGTDTLDPEGEVVAEGPVPSREAIQRVLARFTGAILQVPPQFSAVHVNGRRAHEAARKGETVQLEPRPITIRRLELFEYQPPNATLIVACSKGTYIRSLARDIAEALGTCAHVSRLSRTRIGNFSLEQAVEPELFDASRHLLPPESFFDGCPGFTRLTVTAELARLIARGIPAGRLSFDQPIQCDGEFPVFSREGKLLAMLDVREGVRRYAAVFADGSLP